MASTYFVELVLTDFQELEGAQTSLIIKKRTFFIILIWLEQSLHLSNRKSTCFLMNYLVLSSTSFI